MTFKDILQKCTRCGLHQTRLITVPGGGTITSRILFIGEAPGKQEDLSGLPFQGDAGNLFRKILNEIGLPKDYYITNVIKCRPPENRTPTPEEITACLPYLLHQIKQLINVRIICTLGNTALNVFNPNTSISKTRGNVFNWNGYIFIPTYHPSYVLRWNKPDDSNTIYNQLYDDLEIVKEYYYKIL